MPSCVVCYHWTFFPAARIATQMEFIGYLFRNKLSIFCTSFPWSVQMVHGFCADDDQSVVWDMVLFEPLATCHKKYEWKLTRQESKLELGRLSLTSNTRAFRWKPGILSMSANLIWRISAVVILLSVRWKSRPADVVHRILLYSNTLRLWSLPHSHLPPLPFRLSVASHSLCFSFIYEFNIWSADWSGCPFLLRAISPLATLQRWNDDEIKINYKY